MSAKIYHPKGSMCGVCMHRDKDCSHIKFNEFKPMKKYSGANDPTVFVVVKCEIFTNK